MSGLPEEDLTARFRCVVAIYTPGDGTVTFDGKIEGKITHNPRGGNGFGYDPLFFFPPKAKTLAEIPSREKHEVSHRGTAVRQAASYLRERGPPSKGFKGVCDGSLQFSMSLLYAR